MIKRSIHQEDVTIINTYASNNRAPKYRKQMLTDLKRKMDNNIIVVKDSNSPLSIMDRTPK